MSILCIRGSPEEFNAVHRSPLVFAEVRWSPPVFTGDQRWGVVNRSRFAVDRAGFSMNGAEIAMNAGRFMVNRGRFMENRGQFMENRGQFMALTYLRDSARV